jgi:N6-adenosine-specific RNA methylase IME4
MSIEFHPAANEFPLLDDKRLNELADDITANGQREPIKTYAGKVLDGRNRFRACAIAKVQPRVEALPEDIDPWAYVWSLNGERRDLTNAVRFAIWESCHEKSEAWQAECARLAAEANRKRAEAAKGNQNAAKTEDRNSPATSSGGTVRDHTTEQQSKSSTAKARESRTDRGTVEKMTALKKHRPDLYAMVKSGELTLTQATREMKKEQVSEKVAALPDGKHRVLYVDPPWSYNDTREGLGAGDGQKVDRASTAARDHFPTMSVAELSALDVKSIAAPDAVLFCWATFPLMIDALEVVKAWGFKYKTAFVWDKQRGTFGHYHKAEAELLLVCTRGSCTPDADAKENQIQRWPRAEHSRKPEEARQMIDRMYLHGPKVELFARGSAPLPWNVWGNEAVATAEAAE